MKMNQFLSIVYFFLNLASLKLDPERYIVPNKQLSICLCQSPNLKGEFGAIAKGGLTSAGAT